MKVGFIGTGNMSEAILGGILAKGLVQAKDIFGSALTEKTREHIKKKYHITMTDKNQDVAKNADVLFLGVKPQYYQQVITEIKEDICDNTIVISIAPGKTLAWLKEQFGKEVKLVRTMPNTPALVGEGMTAVCYGETLTPDEQNIVNRLLESFGQVEEVSELLMETVTAVSGSSPAYVFMFIEAMADAAVSGGMSREKAYKFAAQAVLGSAKMVLETGKHPGELKDMVCSPAGTTIEAVRVLEERGMRSAVFEAMKVVEEKSSKM